MQNSQANFVSSLITVYSNVELDALLIKSIINIVYCYLLRSFNGYVKRF